MRAVIYARYSSHNQREESIEQQIEECSAFARQNGMEIVGTYADKAISGKTDRRSNFQRMMRDAEKRKFDVVIAYKSNRIARNMLNALQYEAKLDLLGIKTMYAKEEFGNTAAGRFALRTMMNVNQFYSENMAEDIRRGLMDNAENCKVNGMIPLGYVRGSDGKYKVDEREAEIVREIYRRVISGEKYISIANDLNARCVKTKRGGTWNKNSFRKMLKNVNYIGTYNYSGTVKENGIPPIIERSVFMDMQNFLDRQQTKRRRTENGEYLLTGKLFCGYCGENMVGISGTGKSGDLHYYYSCNGRRMKKSCDKRNVKRDYIEHKIAEITKNTVLTDETIEWIAENAVEFQKRARNGEDIEALKADLADQKRAKSNVMNAIRDGIYTRSTRDMLLEIEADIEKLEAQIEREKRNNIPIEKERIIFALMKFRDGDVTDKKYQKKIIDTFVRSVYLRDDEIRIDYYYDGKDGTVTRSISVEESSYSLPLSPPQVSYTNPNAVIIITARGFSVRCRL